MGRRAGHRFRVAARAPVLALLLAACASDPPPCPAAPEGADLAYLVTRGWHVEIGLPSRLIEGPLAAFRDVFPGAKSVVFGYGKRTFFTAKADTVSEYVLGPVPGPAAIQVTGLNVPPSAAYEPEAVTVMPLPPGGARALSDFLWNDFEPDAAGGPRLIAPGNYPGSQFYAARSKYSLAHTCNTWAADALHAAGLPVDGEGVVFSGQVEARTIEAGACRP